MKRRHFLLLAGSVSLAGLGRLGCFRLARPSAPSGPLSKKAQALIGRALEGLDSSRLLDAHVHLVGLGAGGTGCYVNSRMTSLWSPISYARFSIYRTASGVKDDERADAQYLERLLALAAAVPGLRLLAMAFDQVHDEEGRPQKEESEFFVPNDYVLRLARAHPEKLVPCASIHPYRKDAVAELERVAREGAQAVKWLPNAMRIDPSSPRCDGFYSKLAELELPLITHAGEEKAVDAEEAQRFGNPLHLRRPLERGVKVVVAHCASLGKNPDLDAEVKSGQERPWAENFELFLRLMGEKRWEGRLYADISALAQVNRHGRIRDVLAREELLPRLINGSDYPLPAINVLIQTGALEKAGYLTSEERAALNEIDQHNPLLFDLVLKRTLKVPSEGAERRFPAEAFAARKELFPKLS
ncbi:MAG: amidohydrolase family protein [Myxococcales bacterium]|nr:amidohydrolase family protein [Myxococcales bacterium]